MEKLCFGEPFDEKIKVYISSVHINWKPFHN
jgi:hypothetical protein